MYRVSRLCRAIHSTATQYMLIQKFSQNLKNGQLLSQSRMLLTVDYAPFTEVYGRAAAGG